MDLSADDKEKLRRAIVAGSVLAGVYLFDSVTADEWYVKEKKGSFKLKRRTTLEQIFE
jgi:hypothetical protein